LQTLVNAWPQITAAVPDVNLVVAYGWEGLLTWSGDPTWQAQQEAMRDRFTTWAAAAGNVRFTGRLPKAELYRHMAASSICAYPNNFWETFCLTALECQAAGTPLVTSALGALPTTCNPASNILLSGDPQGAAYQERFAAAVIDLLRANSQREALSAACLDYIADEPCDWADIADRWLTLVWSD
jgi:glycosyltransferase involved in cell wall biosynthesis